MTDQERQELTELRDAVQANIYGKPIQWRHRLVDKWVDCGKGITTFDMGLFRYRPKPEPKTLPWSKPEHVPLNCWMRPPSQDNQRMVTAIKDDGMFIDSVCNGGGSVFFKWSELREFTYSTDRITWQPCVVTEP